MTVDDVLKYASDNGGYGRLTENTQFVALQGHERHIIGTFPTATAAWQECSRRWVNQLVDGAPKHELFFTVETTEHTP